MPSAHREHVARLSKVVAMRDKLQAHVDELNAEIEYMTGGSGRKVRASNVHPEMPKLRTVLDRHCAECEGK